jgi:hypothetical protein
MDTEDKYKYMVSKIHIFKVHIFKLHILYLKITKIHIFKSFRFTISSLSLPDFSFSEKLRGSVGQIYRQQLNIDQTELQHFILTLRFTTSIAPTLSNQILPFRTTSTLSIRGLSYGLVFQSSKVPSKSISYFLRSCSNFFC